MNLPLRNRDKAANQGRTRVELTAEIRRRAYALYVQRGREEGHAREDWEQAEVEVLKQEQRAAAA